MADESGAKEGSQVGLSMMSVVLPMSALVSWCGLMGGRRSVLIDYRWVD